MNLFITSPNPYECAIALDDNRLNKMCVETAQILSTALWHRAIIDPDLYKPVMVHHPIVLWAAEKDENLWFIFSHAHYLLKEYRNRHTKTHGAKSVIDQAYSFAEKLIPKNIKNTPNNFHNSARNLSLNLDFTHIPDVCKAYRAYLNARWKTDIRKPKWTKREPPKWKEQNS